jgi:catechol 2,3-dioxygenase-like lactoylglutathione lyase family enzyme
MNGVPKIFRITVEVADLDAATGFYTDLLGVAGRRHPGERHYFDCGGVVFEVLNVAAGGARPRPVPKSIYFAVDDPHALHARAKALGALAPYQVHGRPAGDVIERPWGEVSFYATDPWGNELCFVKDGTLYT